MTKLMLIFPISIVLLILCNYSSSEELKFLNEKDREMNDKYSIINSIEEILKTNKKGLENLIEKDVIDYVMLLERKELITLAYSMEVYHREVSGQKGLIGGIHDYVFKISDDQIRNFIFKELIEHSEVCEIKKIQELSKSSEQKTEELKDYKRDLVMGDGIHEYLRSLNRRDLGRLAIQLEKYHRKQKDEFIFGGLHDYIDQIPEEDLRSYISKEVNEHLEINNVESLKGLLE